MMSLADLLSLFFFDICLFVFLFVLLFSFGFFCFVLRQGFSNVVAPADLKLTIFD